MENYKNTAQNHQQERIKDDKNDKEKERFSLLPIIGTICFFIGLVRMISVLIETKTITVQSSFLIVIGSILLMIYSESSQRQDAIEKLNNENDRLRREIKYLHEMVEKK